MGPKGGGIGNRGKAWIRYERTEKNEKPTI